MKTVFPAVISSYVASVSSVAVAIAPMKERRRSVEYIKYYQIIKNLEIQIRYN